MLKGFKDFLMRGNIIDLAVAVVVGSAFTAVVTAFTNSIIKPLIALVGSGGVGSSGMVISLGNPGNDLTNIHLEVAINAVITFLITAAVVYFLFVLPMQKIQERRNKGKASDPTDNELLTEIRDLLRQQQGLSSLSSSTTSGDGDSQKTVTTSSSNGSNGSANNGGTTDGGPTNGEKN